jgi:tetratricopeptide (TPR) repeat protein
MFRMWFMDQIRISISYIAIALLAQSLTFISPLPAESARGRGRGGGGGVYLQTPNPTTPAEHNDRGVELGNKGLWQDAIREHELALGSEPDNQTFRMNLSAAQLRYGDSLYNKKRFYDAANQYRGALYVDPNNGPADQHLDEALRQSNINADDPKVRAKLAEDAEISGNYETAIVEYRKCIKMVDDGYNHYRLGQVLSKAGKVVEGYKELRTSVGREWPVDQKNALSDAHRQLADTLKDHAFRAKEGGEGTVGMKRLLNSGIEYRRAVTINPANASAVHGLIEVAREAVAIKPNSFENHLMLAGAYQLGGDFDHAKQEYETCYRLSPNNPALAAARKSFHSSLVSSPLASPALLASTMQSVQTQLQRNPNDAELLYIYGRGKESQGDTRTALAAYNKAASLNIHAHPDLAKGIKRLGGFVAEGALSEAAPQQEAVAPTKAPKGPTAEELKKQKAKEEEQKKQQIYIDIEEKIRSGKLDDAQKDLTALTDTNPGDARAWRLLGNTYEKKGDLDQAAVSYRQASMMKDPEAESMLRQINTSRVQPLLKEADKAASEKNWVQAAATLRQAIGIAPNLPLVHRKLAEALKQLGDTKEADRELKKAQDLENAK